MSTLQGKSISQTYQRLLQTPTEVTDTNLKPIQTGKGQDTSMSISTDKAEFLKVGIGTGGVEPDGLLHVLSVTAGAVTASSSANQLVLENSSDSGLSILSGASSLGNIFFGDVNDNDVGKITYDHSENSLKFTTSGAETMKLDSAGNLNISGSLTQSQDRYELMESFEKLPSVEISAITQSTSATTAVTLNGKHGTITMQAVDLGATDTVEFTFNNDHIFATSSQVLVQISEAGTLADNAIVSVTVHDTTDGSCKIRLGTNGTDIASGTFILYFSIDPHVTPNQNHVIKGSFGGSSDMSAAATARPTSSPGATLLTGTTDNDRTTLLPRTGVEIPGGVNSSAWSAVKFGTENKVEYDTVIITDSSVADMDFQTGLRLTSTNLDYTTDDNQAIFFYDTTDEGGTLGNNANLHFIYSVGGFDFITDLNVVVTANTVYRLKMIFDSNRQISVFVNNERKGLSQAVTAGGTTETDSTKKSLAMTDDIDLIPMTSVGTKTTASKKIHVGHVRISRDFFE